MRAVIIDFPDTEAAVVELCSEGFPDIPTATRVPSDRPDLFVRVNRTGGVIRARILDDAQITVEVWGTDEGEASETAIMLRDFLMSLRNIRTASGLVIATGEVGGIANDPDPDTRNPRYKFTIQITFRGTQRRPAP